MEKKESRAHDAQRTPIKTITLPSGKTATFFQGKGKHSRTASDMIDGKQSKFLPALMSLLTEVDGEKLPMEVYDEMDLKDYNAIQTEISEQNF